MEQSGVLYVLIFYNRVTANTPTPNINFRSRRGFRQRSFPIVTQKKLIDLPRFKKIITLSEIMHKLGYETKLNLKQAPKYRKTGHRCEKCRYVGKSLKEVFNSIFSLRMVEYIYKNIRLIKFFQIIHKVCYQATLDSKGAARIVQV